MQRIFLHEESYGGECSGLVSHWKAERLSRVIYVTEAVMMMSNREE